MGELNGFDEIMWIGFNRKDQKDNKSYLEIKDKRIQILGLKSTGGKTISSKLGILLNFPIYFYTILKAINNSKNVHVRAPSNPAVIAMWMSYFYPDKRFWFKYAGDWRGRAPFSITYNGNC